jgi:uncharacterized protein YidB (DUF937 family)
MALFDQILGGIAAHDTQHAALYSEVGTLVNQAGGVSGLTQQFEQKGLGGVISSWVGGGPNGPISGQQLVNVIGQDRVTAIAAKAGLSEQQVADGISKLLPVVVDHLTPNGTVPAHSPAEVETALAGLKTKLLGS